MSFRDEHILSLHPMNMLNELDKMRLLWIIISSFDAVHSLVSLSVLQFVALILQHHQLSLVTIPCGKKKKAKKGDKHA